MYLSQIQPVRLSTKLSTCLQADGSAGVGRDAGDLTTAVGGVESATPTTTGSRRRPSSTIALLLTTQLQFLAMLSLVDSVATSDAWIADFVKGLR